MLAIVIVSTVGATESYRLDNGMKVILKETHASPMVSSLIFVKSGSKYETRYENGITHFLEHLLFNGTANLSREELDVSIADLGGYINAFTRQELTAFLVLLPQQYIDYGLTIQADMLFNSIIPEGELAKERKVVIEEIKRSYDSPDAPVEDFFTNYAYAGTPYEHPVLGYAEFIENIPRAAIVDYWKSHYIPSNMTLLVIGDFKSSDMKKTVATIFGNLENPPTELETPTHRDLAEHGAAYSSLKGAQVFDTVANVTSTHINFSIAAPLHSDSDYTAFDLLAEYLGTEESSPLAEALTSGDNPPVTELSVGLVPYEEFSRLEISAATDDPERADTIVSLVLEQLASLSVHEANPTTLEGIKTSIRCHDLYNSAKLHYYGFMIAPYLMSAGWDYVLTRAERISEVEWTQCRQTAEKWLRTPDFVATIVRPTDEKDGDSYRPMSMSAEEVIAHFDTATFPEYDLLTGHEIEFPQLSLTSHELSDPAVYHREKLPNGLTLIVKSLPGNEVFGMNVIGKRRTANEGDRQAGITDFVNRCLEKGTKNRDARQLSDDLALIGANVTLYDNPWIPYDDRYTTRRFSFMKYETIDEYAQEGLQLFSEMAFHPAFDSSEVEKIRRSMIGVLARKTGNPRNVARGLFFESLFDGERFARPVMGSPETVGSITTTDLRLHHARFYSPENVIVAIVSGHPVDSVTEWAKKVLGVRPAMGILIAVPDPFKERTDSATVHVDMDKEQIAIYLGGPLPGASDEEAIALTIGSYILSDRLYRNLRERQGLAYSVGSSVAFDRSFGWFYCSMATSAENYQQALDGITFEIEKLQIDGPTPSELRRAKNRIWGRLMSAKLSAINQAYYLAVNDYLGRPLDYDQKLLEGLSEVSADQIRRVASRHFRTTGNILTTAGRKP
ncbi:MAG: insulinase family protein [candidate division Zixibacteria bacterium]|nr:insulinase family protein [candidate division Zixibacteria bacterium]